MQSLLRHGDPRREGYAVVGSIILGAANASVHPDELFRALMDPHNAGGFACMAGRRRYGSWFGSAWRRAEAYAAAYPAIRDANGVRETCAHLAMNVSFPPGRAGATDRSVYLAMLGIAARTGRFTNAASVRELAELGRVHRNTVGTSLRRLKERRVITLIRKGVGERPAVYRIERRAADVPAGAPGGVRGGGTNAARLCSEDCWRWGALGHAAERVYDTLNDEPLTTGEIGDALGLNARTPGRHLRVLAEHGLAERRGDGWIRGGADGSVVIAGAKTLAQQQAEHAAERAVFKSYRRRRRARHVA